MFQRSTLKIGIFISLAASILALYFFGIFDFLSLENLQSQMTSFKGWVEAELFTVIAVYALVYILSTALSIPGATPLTLLAGALFGTWLGFVIVSFASTIGATLAFLLSRYLLRESVEKRFPRWVRTINEGVKREGDFYLFSLRLIPIVPFVVVNLAMGLTRQAAWRFYWISQVGMLPGTLIYVHAGTQFSNLTSLQGILRGEFLIAILLLSTLPWISRFVLARFRNYKIYRKYKKPKRFDYNMVVIGGGAAGLVSAYIAAAVKAKVALIEGHKMGGDCLNYGCVPSKSLIKVANHVHHIRKSKEYGLDMGLLPEVNYAHVRARISEAIATIAPNDSRERYEKLGVECIDGNARIVSPFEVQVGERILTTRNIIVATGARPVIPKIPGIDKVRALTSETLWDMPTLPKKLLILGAGFIGCELAQAYQRLGAHVTVVDKGERVLTSSDQEVSALVEKTLAVEGVEFVLNASVSEFVDARTARIHRGSGEELFSFDALIVAIGREARTEGFGMETLGITKNEKGFIAHNEFMETAIPNIRVAGDCAGPFLLTHMASHQAWYAATNSLFGAFRKFRQDLSLVPNVIFTDPEVAQVGLTQEQAKRDGISVQVHRYDIADLDRAVCENERAGFVKIVTEGDSDRILGATIVAARGGEMLAELVLAMKHGIGLKKILGTVHSYPTWTEANKYVAGQWQKANVSPYLMTFLKRFHRWMR